jgi:hypothetical protein
MARVFWDILKTFSFVVLQLISRLMRCFLLPTYFIAAQKQLRSGVFESPVAASTNLQAACYVVYFLR